METLLAYFNLLHLSPYGALLDKSPFHKGGIVCAARGEREGKNTETNRITLLYGAHAIRNQ